MIKLIASDMDGTLLNDKKELNPEFPKVFEELKKRGIIFCAASGRSYMSLSELFHIYKDSMIFLSDNGTFATNNGKEIYSDIIPKKDRDELMDYIYSLEDKRCIYNTKFKTLFENSNRNMHFIKEVIRYNPAFKVVSNLRNVEEDALKIEMFKEDKSDELAKDAEEIFGDRFLVATSSDDWCSFIKKGSSKGKAISTIQKMYDISPEETMVFGDHMNDYEMMQSAKYSFAMENAVDDIKKISNYIAGNNNDNAVLETIKAYFELDI